MINKNPFLRSNYLVYKFGHWQLEPNNQDFKKYPKFLSLQMRGHVVFFINILSIKNQDLTKVPKDFKPTNVFYKKLIFYRLTDAKLKTLVPLMVRFRTVKIGGKQDYGVKGIQDLRMYMEELKVDR